MNLEITQKHLNNNIFKFHIKDTVTSTNTLLKEMAHCGEAEFTVLMANKQTDGRGRVGKSFFSPDGTGIYMSILLRPKFSPQISLLLTTCAAVCCARAIEKVSQKKADIKWVNDIYIDGKKVCGILAESSLNGEDSDLNFTVLGIGINLYAPKEGFPDDIKDKAGCLFKSANNIDYLRSILIAEILNEFMCFYPALSPADFLDEYRNRSILTGKTVTVTNLNKTKKATVIGIDDSFGLVVKYDDGESESLRFGEIDCRIESNIHHILK